MKCFSLLPLSKTPGLSSSWKLSKHIYFLVHDFAYDRPNPRACSAADLSPNVALDYVVAAGAKPKPWLTRDCPLPLSTNLAFREPDRDLVALAKAADVSTPVP